VIRLARTSEKNFQGRGGNGKKIENYQKIPKIALFTFSRGRGGATKKDQKIAKEAKK